MKVKWQSSAKEDLRQICYYYRHVKQSLLVASKIKEAMFAAARYLETFPDLGARELSLDHIDGACFRYLVVEHHYKMIYFYESGFCHIVAIWDCRNNPEELEDRVS